MVQFVSLDQILNKYKACHTYQDSGVYLLKRTPFPEQSSTFRTFFIRPDKLYFEVEYGSGQERILYWERSGVVYRYKTMNTPQGLTDSCERVKSIPTIPFGLNYATVLFAILRPELKAPEFDIFSNPFHDSGLDGGSEEVQTLISA